MYHREMIVNLVCGKGAPKIDFVDEIDQEVFVSDVQYRK